MALLFSRAIRRTLHASVNAQLRRTTQPRVLGTSPFHTTGFQSNDESSGKGPPEFHSLISHHHDKKRREKEIARVKQNVLQLYKQKDFDAALEAAQHAKALVEEDFGTMHPVFASCLNDEALMFKELGELGSAIEAYEQAVNVYAATVGEFHTNYLTALFNQCRLTRTQAQYQEEDQAKEVIEAMFPKMESLLKVRKQMLKEDDPILLQSIELYAQYLQLLGRAEEGEKLLRDNIKKTKIKYGASKLETGRAQNVLAVFLKQENKLDEAIDLYTEALKIHHRNIGPLNQATIEVKYNLALAHETNGNEKLGNRFRQEVMGDIKRMEDRKSKISRSFK